MDSKINTNQKNQGFGLCLKSIKKRNRVQHDKRREHSEMVVSTIPRKIKKKIGAKLRQHTNKKIEES